MHAFLGRLAGLGLTLTIDHWMGTLNYRASIPVPNVDPIHRHAIGSAIYVFWHEYILIPFYLRSHCGIKMLVSQHRDAEILTHAATFRGFELVRGSSTRGGVAALHSLLRKGRGSSLAITPDGPRGPRRQLSPGCIYLASRLEMPIVLMGFGFNHPFRIRQAWDQFALPRLGSRARAVFSRPIDVPRSIDRKNMEDLRLWLEQSLNRLTLEAEAWAEDEQERPYSAPFFRSARRKNT